MKRFSFVAFFLIILTGSAAFCADSPAEASKGVRPYEMDWANRTADDHPALVDFESADSPKAWVVETTPGCVASFERSQQQQLFGDWVAKLTYRALPPNERQGKALIISVRPESPIPVPEKLIQGGFDAISLWVYGNRWSWVTDKTTPAAAISLLFIDKQGEIEVPMRSVNWKEWYLLYMTLDDSQQRRLNQPGVSFDGFRIRNGANEQDRVLYFDSLCLFKEQRPNLTFLPRPKRGLNLADVQDPGTNTGAAPDDPIQKLPFPTRPETILPDSFGQGADNSIAPGSAESSTFELKYQGQDGKLVYRYAPKTGTWSDWTAQWNDGQPLAILTGGGVETIIDPDGKPVPVTGRELVRIGIIDGKAANQAANQTDTNKLGDGTYLEAIWKLSADSSTAAAPVAPVEVTYRFRILGKSLVIDTFCPAEAGQNGQTGRVGKIVYGQLAADDLTDVKLVTVPYLTYAYGGQLRPAIACFREPKASTGLFLSDLTDWYVSNASRIFGGNGIDNGLVKINGGTEYLPKTDGLRNSCFDRYFVTLSPNFDEVLPTIPNPISPWKQLTGTKLWRSHGASSRDGDKKYWRNVWRHGMREVIVTDHEVCWRDGGESFTFRTKPAPKKGGDEGWIDYSRFMQQELGFIYGPYNNFTDFATVNEYWSPDMITRSSNGRLVGAWARCYAPKPSRAIEFCAWQAPVNQKKFQFSCAYCDVHTAVTPWERTDFDSRVPGAGTFAATFYAFGEIMLRQKAAWNGPVYSEGPMHSLYSGLTDGNYAQDQGYNIPFNPWLVNFDLLKMHPHENNFGMGNYGYMFYGRQFEKSTEPKEVDALADRFTCATAAFGHPGFLVLGEVGMDRAWRNYFLLQQIQSRYCLTNVQSIKYVDAAGKQLDVSDAILSDDFRRSQLVVTYLDGTIIAANGSVDQRMKTTVAGLDIDLPPAGWTGRFAQSQNLPSGSADYIESFSGDCYNGVPLGNRADYAVSPKYIFVDGRGSFVQFPAACADGPALCRFVDDKTAEIILQNKSQAGFAIDAASAKALDFDGKELGDAEIRTSGRFTFVQPVAGAFSYLVTLRKPGVQTIHKPGVGSAIPGETLNLPKAFGLPKVPADAQSGKLIWFQGDTNWAAVFVVAPFETTAEIVDNRLNLTICSRVADAQRIAINAPGIGKKELDLPPMNQSGFAEVRVDFGWPMAREIWEQIPVEITAIRGGDSAWSSSAGQAVTATKALTVITERQKLLFPFNFAIKPQSNAIGTGWLEPRGGQPTQDFGATGGHVTNALGFFCGGVGKDGLAMHPAYKGQVGRVWAEYQLTVPKEDVCLRGSIGKQDGGDLGDGIWYSVEVRTNDVSSSEANNVSARAETNDAKASGFQTVASAVVKTHGWQAIEANLSPWKGQTITLRLVADPGPNNNTIADHACWADLRLETKTPILIRRLGTSSEVIEKTALDSTRPITKEQLKSAKKITLCYRAMGLAGDDLPYVTNVSINGQPLGLLQTAAGDEARGTWSNEVGVPVSPEAIDKLDAFNRIELFSPDGDCFSIGEFRLKIELADGTVVSSFQTPTHYTIPDTWLHKSGILIKRNDPFVVPLWIDLR